MMKMKNTKMKFKKNLRKQKNSLMVWFFNKWFGLGKLSSNGSVWFGISKQLPNQRFWFGFILSKLKYIGLV